MGSRLMRSPWVPAVASAAAAVSLIGPWARSGVVDRSSVELLATAGALDVLSDAGQILAAAAWYLVVLLAAGSVLAAGWGHRRLAACLALPMGPALALTWGIVASSPLTVRWGAPMGTALGLTATIVGGLVLLETAGTERNP